ncbi:MAG: YkvA family protein [Sphaerochaeta sp.]|jgi:uncharacterized membrane protein YkvA (DUF1232 family)|uniref:YkvA family protein n=1 Tax=Sphaerochaeta sp. TaxID=1972642 RepID=UPI002FCC3816
MATFKVMLQKRARELKKQLSAVYYASKDERVGILAKLIMGIALLYALSPIDLIPDFIPVLGYLDDLIILPALIALAIRLIPAPVFQDAQKKAEQEPISLGKNWTFAVLFIGIWVVVCYVLVRAIFR